MGIWLHRISHEYEISKPLLTSGYLSIGFADFLDHETFWEVMIDPELDSQAKWEFMKGMPVKCGWEGGSRTIHNLWRFLMDFKPGDLILVPTWGSFSLYRLQGSVIPIIDVPPETLRNIRTVDDRPVTVKNKFLSLADVHEHDRYDLGFVWPVIEFEAADIPRGYADAALTARMKVYQTNAWIDDLGPNIQKAVEAFKAKQPPSLYRSVMEIMPDKLLEIIHQEVNPSQLEKIIAWYFRKIGAAEVVIPAKNAPKEHQEADADVVASFDALKIRVHVQVKHHQGETDDWAVAQIKAYARERQKIPGTDYQEIFWVVSTCDNFSVKANDIAVADSVRLINGRSLAKMLLDVGLEDLNSAFAAI